MEELNLKLATDNDLTNIFHTYLPHVWIWSYLIYIHTSQKNRILSKWITKSWNTSQKSPPKERYWLIKPLPHCQTHPFETLIVPLLVFYPINFLWILPRSWVNFGIATFLWAVPEMLVIHSIIQILMFLLQTVPHLQSCLSILSSFSFLTCKI